MSTKNDQHWFLHLLQYTLHKVRDQCPFCRADGKPVDKYLDKKGEDAYYELLDKTRKLSLASRDQDDPYNTGGYHCFFPSGNGRLIHAQAENAPIIFGKLCMSFIMVEIV
uniref:Uncharacterized protein n=1 Tax=Solanum lycopersicum TaxID=4081 RepID=A0A3Q7GKV8_SOLLC